MEERSFTEKDRLKFSKMNEYVAFGIKKPLLETRIDSKIAFDDTSSL